MKITKHEKAFLDALATAGVNPDGVNICQFFGVNYAGSYAEFSGVRTTHYRDGEDEYDCTDATISFPRPWQIQNELTISRKAVSLPAGNAVKEALNDLQAHPCAPLSEESPLADEESCLIQAVRDYGLANETGLQGWGLSICADALADAYNSGMSRDGEFDDVDDDDVNDAVNIEQCVCFAPKEATFIPDFYFALKACVEYYDNHLNKEQK